MVKIIVYDNDYENRITELNVGRLFYKNYLHILFII